MSVTSSFHHHHQQQCYPEARPPCEMWRSKLGTNYPKAYMEQHETEFLHELQALRNLPANRRCADCGANGTVWSSVNLGVFLCMTCGAHHRSLGTHISRPKGCSGTYWWGPDEIARMKELGNAAAAELYGDSSTIPPGLTNAGNNGVQTMQWKQYLMDKYVHKKFAPARRVDGGQTDARRPSHVADDSIKAVLASSSVWSSSSPTADKKSRQAQELIMLKESLTRKSVVHRSDCWPNGDLIRFDDNDNNVDDRNDTSVKPTTMSPPGSPQPRKLVLPKADDWFAQMGV